MNSDRDNVAKVVVEEEKEEVVPALCTLSVSINPLGGGSVSPPSGSRYELGTQVTLTATPSAGYEFDCWAGEAFGASPTTTITMDSNKSVVANFIKFYQPNRVHNAGRVVWGLSLPASTGLINKTDFMK